MEKVKMKTIIKKLKSGHRAVYSVNAFEGVKIASLTLFDGNGRTVGFNYTSVSKVHRLNKKYRKDGEVTIVTAS